jgi:putative membrane protein
MKKKTLFLTKQHLSIALIWLFHVSGILGIIYGDATWFVKATPINLLVSFLLLIANTDLNRKTLFMIVLCFSAGMITEILGVKYGLIFGSYSYGSTLGFKFIGVPIIIGINWCILIFITGFIAQFFTQNLLFKILIGVGLMLFLDLVIEPIAPIMDFWTFESGIAGLNNYIGWTFVAFPLQLIYHKMKIKIEGPFPFHLFLLQFLFFTLLLLKLNTP